MLDGLWLDAFVRRDDEHHQANAAESGERVVHEALVPRHVDEADLQVVLDAVREAQIDGDSTRLLFLPAVAVDAGERRDERRLTVIDVAGGADDETALGGVEWGHGGQESSATDGPLLP